jgi:thiol:disulfide interchange protein DsbG
MCPAQTIKPAAQAILIISTISKEKVVKSLYKTFVFALTLAGLVLSQNLQAAASKEALVYRSAQKTAWIGDPNKNAPHVAYIAIEPNCYYCQLLYRELAPYINSGQLSARWIVGSFLSRTSQGKGAAILESSNPYAALLQNEANYSKDSGEGGAQELTNISAGVKAKLERNNRFLSRYGFGTPVLIYRDKNKNIHVLEGLLSSSTVDQAIKEMDSQY